MSVGHRVGEHTVSSLHGHPNVRGGVSFFSVQKGDLLAYGGADGLIFLLPSTTTAGGIATKTPRVVQRYDDEARAVAVSPDGRWIAVGLEDGSTCVIRLLAVSIRRHLICRVRHRQERGVVRDRKLLIHLQQQHCISGQCPSSHAGYSRHRRLTMVM